MKLVNEVILTGKSPATTQRSSFTPTTGMRRTLRRNVLSINTSNDLKEVADRTRVDLQGDIANDLAPTKYNVEISAPIHHVRYNHTVNVKRKNGRNKAISAGLDDDLDSIEIVKQLELHYPSGKSIIKVGENDIDYFDDIVRTSRTEDGLIDTTI